MVRDLKRLSKTVARALRHAPGDYGLTLDEAGWTPVESLLAGLQRQSAWQEVTSQDLEAILALPDKQRYEMRDGRIRALYGHSTELKIEKIATVPPPALFHGTTPRLAAVILREGLRPMRRQYVHLSADEETAAAVGRRRAAQPTILLVAAARAHAAGVAFYEGNQEIWLADEVPPAYIGHHGGPLPAVDRRVPG